MMMLLAKRQVNSIWVEAGASLAGALLQAGLVDELILYIAPKLLGDNGRGLCHLPGLERLADAPEFVFSDVRQVGPDLRCACGRNTESRARAPVLQKRRAGDERI